ncbi:hypothetical protein L0F63_006712, partial [Massospora cicadina]
SPEQRKESNMARKAADKDKQKENKVEAAQKEAAKRNIEQQHGHLFIMTAPREAQQSQD